MKNKTIVISQVNIERQVTALLILLENHKIRKQKKKVTS